MHAIHRAGPNESDLTPCPRAGLSQPFRARREHIRMSQTGQTTEYSTARGRYKLIAPIAEGHTATMWRGRDTVAQHDVAVKRLRDVSDGVALQRFEQEGAVGQRVSHPGLVPLRDSWFDKDEAALVFDYVPGTTL